MDPSPTNLLVTLVSGLDPTATSAVAAALTGRTSPDPPSGGSGVGDSGGFAFELADRLFAIADQGDEGHVAVGLDPFADTIEVGLLIDTLFAERDDQQPRIRLRDVVTVASVADIRRLLFSDGVASEDPVSDYNLAERLARQLEFATVIVLVGSRAVTPVLHREVDAFLARLNPHALIAPLSEVPTITRSRRPARRMTGLGQSMGWMLELAGRAGPPTTTHSVNSVVFRDPRPFHPTRLAEVIDGCLEPARVGTIIRSRGLIRLASRPDRVGSWASAGRVLTIEPTTMLSWDADSPVGQELVFFGVDLQHDELVTALSASLLADDELVAGPMEWANYHDPFPAWEVEHGH